MRISVEIPGLEIGLYAIRDIRVHGIDTPEKRPKRKGRTQPGLAREKAAAKAARQAAIALLESNGLQFQVTNIQLGKYAGRVLGSVIVDGVDLGDHLISLGLAKSYDGGTKPDWGWEQ